MAVTVVGSIALDTVETTEGSNIEGLGGAATYFSLAAANYTEVHLVGVVGEDFSSEHVALFHQKNINLDGLERAAGRTFRWTGRYHEDMNERDTLDTQLNVFQDFHPKLPKAACEAEYLFLGNIHPALQLEVLDQANARFVGLDTMNLWIDISLEDLKRVLKHVDVLIINDSEARMLSGQRNLLLAAAAIRALGPNIVVLKKGEHGCMLFQGENVFSAPAFPLRHVADPTGAGDTFAGGFMGYLAERDATDWATLCKAVIHGTVVASYTCEQFGPDRLTTLTRDEILRRYEAIKRLTHFD